MNTVWVVLVGNRINSVWQSEAGADAHRERLLEVNGDQLAARVMEFEVRE